MPASGQPAATRCFGALSLLITAAALATTTGQDARPPSPLDAVVRMVESGELASAERALRDLLARQAGPAVHDLLGVVLSRQGRLEEAEQQFERALAADPDSLDARQHLARLYLLQKRRDAAVTQLRAAARLGPLERDLAMTLASVELAAGKTAAGERQLKSVAERFGSVQALLQLSRIATSQGDTQGSLAALQQALELAPAAEEVLAANARASLAAGLPVPAIIALGPLIRMHPAVAEYPYMMGIARMQVGDMPDSIESLRRSLELDADRAPALIGLGVALNHQKRHAEAREALTRSLALEPNNIDGLAALAETEAGLAELDSAEQHALRALAQDASQATANLALGLVRMQQGRYAEAREALDATVAADPRSTRAHYQLSLAHSRLGNREKSKQHLDLYRRLLKEDQTRMVDLRSKLGLPEDGGMRP